MHEAGLKQCAILLTQWTPLFLYIPGPLCDVVFKKAASSEVSFSLRADMLHCCRLFPFLDVKTKRKWNSISQKSIANEPRASVGKKMKA